MRTLDHQSPPRERDASDPPRDARRAVTRGATPPYHLGRCHTQIDHIVAARPKPKPDIGSQSGTVETNPDGTGDIYFGPTAPGGRASNWLQTVQGKGFFVILRLYNPLQPFFDKTRGSGRDRKDLMGLSP